MMTSAPVPRALGAQDAVARERALDVAGSFLVQAPAGSGKTGLLIQRFLALLARVNRPERIVALTFTRKAAAEMRARILAALRDADGGLDADSEHAATTLRLGSAALDQNRRLGWLLLAYPARLKVMTIDAFCASILRRAPLSTLMGASPRVEERARALHLRAARDAVNDAAADDACWRRLFVHLDNDAGRVVELIADLLARRDQWLDFIVGGDRSSLRAALEAALHDEIVGELRTIARVFPRHLADALPEYERYASANFAGAPERAVHAAALVAVADAGGLPPPAVASLEQWQTLADWLLRSDKPTFRLTVGTKDGFPAIGKGEGAADRRSRNEAMRVLLGELAQVPGLAEALDVARRLPPSRYAEGSWTLIETLAELLPRIAAQLTVTFSEAGAIDFAQAQIAARRALGSAEAPSDLLVRLDATIEHLLVDEFQDTSFAQLGLIERLTADWQPGDGRTLFAVGDPMQSIYRFREAEVRIFIEAKRRGAIGDFPIESLTLSRNFRSQARLVEWTNDAFSKVLGAVDDPWRSAVAFAPATAARPAALDGATLDVVDTAEAEANAVVGHVTSAIANGYSSVAVLVRARTHLDAILPALRKSGVPYTAVDLDSLSQRQAVLDLAALTHALSQPADRLAWLSVLRAPWCAVSLPDLFTLASAADDAGSFAAILEAPDIMSRLSESGRTRFACCARVLSRSLAARGRTTLSTRVRGAWLALGGPATLDDPIDLDAAERFFATLAAHEVGGDVPDWNSFIDALSELRAGPGAGRAARVQIMTLHRAKGLEFDVVVMPGLARNGKRGRAELIRWRRRANGLLLGTVNVRGGTEDRVYEYLKQVDDDEENAELGRLLYVGCTRARERLHLAAVLPVTATSDGATKRATSVASSAMARFGDAIGGMLPPVGAPSSVSPRSPALPMLMRLPAAWSIPVPATGVSGIELDEAPREELPFDWARETARHVGTIAHRLFAQLGREGIEAWDVARVESMRPRFRIELRRLGVADAEIDSAAMQIESAVRSLLDDSRGRWLFASGHIDAHSEWALAGVDAGGIAHVVPDRTFVDGNTRYIVDFKTSSHEGADVEAFLDREAERYRAQLARYAQIVRAIDPRPIRLALYYPLLRGWREWPAAEG